MSAMKVLGLVVARSGSKGVPGKNLRALAGHPLVGYAVRAGIRAASISSVVISTDDRAIADAARRDGAEAPFLRPPKLARDDSPVLDSILHAVAQLEAAGETFDAVCVIQPTAPFRCAEEIDRAIRTLEADPAADSIVALAPVEDLHPRRLRRIVDGEVRQFLEGGGDREGQQRQDHSDERAYRRTGDFYIARVSTLKTKKSLYGDRVLPFDVPAWRAVNIDTEADLLLAEAMLGSAAFRDRLAHVRRLFDD